MPAEEASGVRVKELGLRTLRQMEQNGLKNYETEGTFYICVLTFIMVQKTRRKHISRN